MERNLDSIEIGAGPYGELIDLIVERARRSVEKHETRQYRIEGCMSGLERCAEMRDWNLQDFELELMTMEQKDKELKVQLNEEEIGVDDYWRQRCATAQIEYCYEILRTAYLAEHGSLPDMERRSYSARSALQYNLLALKLGLPLLS